MAQELEVRMIAQMRDVLLGPGEQIVDAQHVMAVGEQAVAQMRAEETGTAGDHHPRA